MSTPMSHWYSTAGSGNTVTYQVWNELVDDLKTSPSVSSQIVSLIGHSSNADLHFPSSNLTSWLDVVYAQSGAGDGVGGISSWQDFSAGTGIGGLTGTYAISGTDAPTISVKGYSSISSNALDSYNWVSNSGSRYEDILSSGNEYSSAYASAQIAVYDNNFSWISSQTISGGTSYGNFRYRTSIINDDYSASVGEYLLASSGNTMIVKLPDSHIIGDNVTIKNIGSNTVTISGQGGDTIDGNVEYDINFQYESVKCLSDGSNWYLI